MAKLLDKLAPFTSMKLAIIKWLLDSMPVSTRIIVIDRAIAAKLPKMHIKYRPNQRDI